MSERLSDHERVLRALRAHRTVVRRATAYLDDLPDDKENETLRFWARLRNLWAIVRLNNEIVTVERLADE
jgi:hypothetical protein